jgi:aminoglycoside phosphotransferase (APT) family kinase protein
MQQIWHAEVTVDSAMARELVETQFPDLSPVAARMLAAGWDNTAHVINESFVFRFPRRAIAVPLVIMEIQLLPWLASRVPLKIPVPNYVGEPSDKFRFFTDLSTAAGARRRDWLASTDSPPQSVAAPALPRARAQRMADANLGVAVALREDHRAD